MLARLLVTLVLAGSSLALAQLPRVDLSAGIHRIGAEVAATDSARQQGLMHRRSMPPQEGMLFVLQEAAPFCMWMRNTFIPLSVAFLDEKGVILNIADMTPQSDVSHCAKGPAKFALEMNRGWFAERRIAPGTRISGVDRAPPAR